MSGWLSPLDKGLEGVYNLTGKWLGIAGGDYFLYGDGYFPGYPSYFNAYAINYWNNNGLVTLSFSMPNPTTAGGLNDLTRLDVADLMNPKTPTGANFTRILTYIGNGLLELQAAGVVAMIRPFHEMNGNWFWWGTKFLNSTQFIALWKYTYNYWTSLGITNHIYIWAPNAQTNAFTDELYPGGSYVDIVGMDLYTSVLSNYVTAYNSLLNFGKPVALSEFGPNNPYIGNTSFSELTLIATLNNLMPRVVYFQQWWGDNNYETGWSILDTQDPKLALEQPRILNRGDLAFFGPTAKNL